MHRLLCLLSLVLVGAGCASSGGDDSGASFGSDVQVDVAVYFVEGTTDEDISEFILRTLSKPPRAGRQGQDHVDGVQYTSGDYTRRAAYITFSRDASAEEREAVMHAVNASALVDRVEFDVVPRNATVGS